MKSVKKSLFAAQSSFSWFFRVLFMGRCYGSISTARPGYAQLMERLELIHVECYSGYKANETPRAFIWKGRRYGIVEIRDRWYEGGISRRSIRLDYYKVLAEDGREYILRYHGLFDKWALLLK